MRLSYVGYGSDSKHFRGHDGGIVLGRVRGPFRASGIISKRTRFGLHDVLGNAMGVDAGLPERRVIQGAPSDGERVDESGDCSQRVLRGGHPGRYAPGILRSANRDRLSAGVRDYSILGFRVARTIN